MYSWMFFPYTLSRVHGKIGFKKCRWKFIFRNKHALPLLLLVTIHYSEVPEKHAAHLILFEICFYLFTR
jgi:hypothetical protein